jgi:hypothetical protein
VCVCVGGGDTSTAIQSWQYPQCTGRCYGGGTVGLARPSPRWRRRYLKLVKQANSPLPPGETIGDLSWGTEIKNRLQCKSFGWFLENVRARSLLLLFGGLLFWPLPRERAWLCCAPRPLLLLFDGSFRRQRASGGHCHGTVSPVPIGTAVPLGHAAWLGTCSAAVLGSAEL